MKLDDVFASNGLLANHRVNFQNYGKTIVKSLPPAPFTQKLEKVESFFRSKGI